MKEIIIGCANKKYLNNRINRNKHYFVVQPLITIINYFNNIENLYFLSIGIFQLLTIEKIGILPKYWSPTGPYSTIIPLLLCLLLEIFGDLYKWMILYIEDYNRNHKKYLIFSDNEWIEKSNQCIYPGEIIALEKNKNIPMDILLIDYYSNYCKINLANLNGESNPLIIDKINHDLKLNDYINGKMRIISDNKHNITDINGKITLKNMNMIDFNHKSLLVNGANLLSENCLGIVINCGIDCKLYDKKCINNNKENTILIKISDFMMNKTIYILICLVLLITFYRNDLFLKDFIQSWIILNGIIPFSIKILLSIFRNLQCKKFINIKVNNSYLIDQFPFIDYILSDKTGTITNNLLELIKFIDYNEKIYDFTDNKNLNIDLIRALGLCINIIDETPEDKMIYERYLDLNSKISYLDDLVILDMNGIIEEYKRYPIANLGFNLNRPISSQIYLNKKTNEYIIYTKASIKKLHESLHINDSTKLNELDDKLTEMDNSLRILGIGYRKIDKIEIEEYENSDNKELNFEKNLNLIGLLGIQDSLIFDVKRCINWFLNNNIGFGLLTGDRKITTLAVAKNAGIITDNSEIINLDLYNIRTIKNNMNNIFVFNNEFLVELNNNIEEQKLFINLLKEKPRIIGYNLNPNDKKNIVDYVEQSKQKTLAIGDGFNDIKMLTRANIGISLNENIDNYGDFVIDNFLKLEECFKISYHYSQRNQILSLITMFKSCSIGFLLFWVLIYGNGINGLFNFYIHQGFHFVWCLIHPYIYVLLEKPDNNNILNNKIRNILNNYSMSLLILIACLESSLLMYYLKFSILMNIFTSYAVFYLVIQINLILLCLDLNLKSILIQIVNLFFVGLYVHYDNNIMIFINSLMKTFLFKYLFIIIIIHSIIGYIYKKHFIKEKMIKKLS